MRTKRATYTLLIVLALLGLFLATRWQEPVRREAFDRKPQQLTYTPHALCRMSCRHISRADVGDIIEHGVINLSKSFRRTRPCPTFALQGETASGNKIRVIFEQCEKETRVITCYPLNQHYECHCPGDEN